MTYSVPEFSTLNIAVIGGGLGGLAAALALRRAGLRVKVYERRDFNVEVGASISCAANGTQWLHEWGVDVESGRPVILMKLVMREWETSTILNQYDLSGYEAEWGNVYNMFHRQDMHKMLLDSCTSEQGVGEPVEIVIDHICETVDPEHGIVTFRNGQTVQADLIIGSDGIRSVVRGQIGVVADVKSAPQTCYRCNVKKEVLSELGLEWAADPAIQFWGGMPHPERSQYYKIVMSPCAGGDIVSFYCFMPTELTSHTQEGFVFKEVPVSDILAGAFDTTLSPDVKSLLENSVERKPWRLYVHQPYSHWYKGRACILGDAAHPMMPHQSQGACMAIEDAAALGLVFSRKYGFTKDVEAGLAMYQAIRKPRATRVQQSSARALENLNERIGFSSLTAHDAAIAAAAGKLTVNEMNSYNMHDHLQSEVDKLVSSKCGPFSGP